MLKLEKLWILWKQRHIDDRSQSSIVSESFGYLFFLYKKHPSDTPGVNLVPILLLGSEKYSSWSRSIKIALLGNNKLGFVQGRCLKENYDIMLHNKWEWSYAIVLSWTMNTVLKGLLTSIVDASVIGEAWNRDLTRWMDLGFTIQKEIAILAKGVSIVSSYYNKMTNWEICEMSIVLLIPTGPNPCHLYSSSLLK